VANHPELAESLVQFITVWKRIGKPFARIDQIDRPGLAITWTVLHATEAGYQVYLRVVYHPTAKFIGCTLKH
jgi:hypothetical protein